MRRDWQRLHAQERATSRVLRSKAEAQATYDRLSRWYDLVEAPFERTAKQVGLRLLAARTGERVLEIGCGTGLGIVALAHAVGSSGQVVGLDLSEGMLAVTRERVKRADVSERVELVQADAVHLPFADARFDAIFMSFALELFDTPEIPLVLGECARVLRPAGRLAVVALAQRRMQTPMVRLYEWAHRRFPRAVDCRPIPVRVFIEDAPFVIAEVRELHMWGLPVDCVLAVRP